MQYRTMKTTGDSLSVLGYGCMRLPRKNIGIDVERATTQLRYAIDHGVNYLDTALTYPGNEVFLGKALADGYREKIRLATKLPPYQVRKREDMDMMLDVQLRNLQTDHIDYYLFHSMNGSDWKKLKGLGVTDFIRKAKTDGRIRFIGFSSHTGTAEFIQIIDDYEWDFCPIQYNILDENNQAGTEGLRYAASKGLGIIIMEPLRGGSLARTPPKEIMAIWDEADRERSPAEWALRWVWNHPEVTVVLSGMNDLKHIDENLKTACEAFPGSLSGEEIDLVSRVKEAYQKRLKVGCTGCQYCMPCPAGVNIPVCFESYNNMYLENPLVAKIKYMIHAGGGMDGKSPKAYASQCRGCNKCVKACTQHILIPDDLKKASKELEGPDMKAISLLIMPLVRIYLKFQRWRTIRKARI